MNKLALGLLVIAEAAFAVPSTAAEFWDCTFVVESHDARPGHPPPLTMYANYAIEKSEVKLLNGVARYRILENTDFGLTATNHEICDWCDYGPLIDTEVISINKVTNEFTKTSVGLSKYFTLVDTYRGTCHYMVELQK